MNWIYKCFHIWQFVYVFYMLLFSLVLFAINLYTCNRYKNEILFVRIIINLVEMDQWSAGIYLYSYRNTLLSNTCMIPRSEFMVWYGPIDYCRDLTLTLTIQKCSHNCYILIFNVKSLNWLSAEQNDLSIFFKNIPYMLVFEFNSFQISGI